MWPRLSLRPTLLPPSTSGGSSVLTYRFLPLCPVHVVLGPQPRTSGRLSKHSTLSLLDFNCVTDTPLIKTFNSVKACFVVFLSFVVLAIKPSSVSISHKRSTTEIRPIPPQKLYWFGLVLVFLDRIICSPSWLQLTVQLRVTLNS